MLRSLTAGRVCGPRLVNSSNNGARTRKNVVEKIGSDPSSRARLSSPESNFNGFNAPEPRDDRNAFSEPERANKSGWYTSNVVATDG